ncbi:hypothetical protein [Pseudodesulfovibrio methanolicus]|uniref:Uncharacterized protein n=1 Tax=Pseudodesulfovibrio methanolicus TaxID=3126690 RepID=A0ABZ2IQS6_9BACT
MKKTVMLLIVCLALFFSTLAWAGDVYVKGYIRKDGTYVAPHYRSSPDGNPYNNWSTKGNTNPYTGKPGYKNPNPNNSFGIQSNPYSTPKKQ